MASAAVPVPAPLFILGAPRSGTSLLSRMLGSHPSIAVPDETKIFEAFVRLLPLYGDLREPARLRRLARDVLGWRWIRRLPDPPGLEDVLARVRQPDLCGVFGALLAAWTAGRGKPRWGEKSPNNLFYWDLIEAGFPTALVVHIVRDGRDVALSQIAAPFGPKTMALAAERWVRHIDLIRAIGQRLGPARYAELRYEDLLAEPEATITRVLQLVGEPFDPAMLQFHKNARPVGTDPLNDRNILKPLQVRNSGKWASEIGPDQLAVFESIAGPTLDACGYARATAAPPIASADRAYRRYIEHPPRKLVAMVRNSAGIAEGLERERIRLRLYADAALGRLGRDGSGDPPTRQLNPSPS